MPPAHHSFPRPSSPEPNANGSRGQSKSEPVFKSAWGERERGRESPFAIERSGSTRAEGAAPETGHPKGCPVSGAGGGTRTHTMSPSADFESATSTIPSHRHTDRQYISDSRKYQVFPSAEFAALSVVRGRNQRLISALPVTPGISSVKLYCHMSQA